MQCLPVNGVPSGIMIVESDTDIMSNEITSPDLRRLPTVAREAECETGFSYRLFSHDI